MRQLKAIMHKPVLHSIKWRMIAVYFAIIFLMLAVTILIFFRVARQYSETLYQETSDSLFCISNDMKLYLDAVEAESRYMVTDSSLQKKIALYTQNESQRVRTNLRSEIESIVYSYADGSHFIKSITLLTSGFTVCRGTTSLQESDEYISELTSLADQYRGKEFWAASQSDPSTILLVRACREIANLSLQTLGYVIFRVDMDRLADSLMANYEYLSSETPLIITNQTTDVILYPAELPDQSIAVIRTMPENCYRILTVGSDRMFAVTHTLSDPDWKYYLLIPYNAVFQSMTTSVVTILLVLGLTAIVMLIAATLFSNSISRHFYVLRQKMERVQAKNFDPMPTNYDYSARTDEIGFLHQSFDTMLLELKRAIDDNYTKQLLLKEAQIKSLEQQINPHFLYNTLDLIYWNARMNSQEDICTIVDALAKLLQASLSRHQEITSLRDELGLCHYYTNIQKLRFGNKLLYSEEYEPSLLEKQVPFMCLQPLLENAVKYGVEQSIEPCQIQLRISCDDKLRIAVTNEGSEVPENLMELLYSGEKTPHGHGIGLINIDTRTKLLFGTEYGLSFSCTDEETTAILSLPLSVEPKTIH